MGVKVVDTDLGKFGLGICYDLRFPEFAIAMSKMGADVMLYAGNFPADVTGPIHWELLLKARALDNLNYVVGNTKFLFIIIRGLLNLFLKCSPKI